jgi:hypothetical protein
VKLRALQRRKDPMRQAPAQDERRTRQQSAGCQGGLGLSAFVLQRSEPITWPSRARLVLLLVHDLAALQAYAKLCISICRYALRNEVLI